MNRLLAVRLLVGAGLVLAASALHPAARVAAERPASVRSFSSSLSEGLPWAGRLQSGVYLRPSSTIRHLPDHARSGNFFGTAELVGLLQRASRAVAQRWPGSQLSVGELSARRGGWIHGHHSHRNGRDADVAFFMRNDRGTLARFWRFVSFGRDPQPEAAPEHLRFDDQRNWSLVSAMLSDSGSRIQYLFVSNEIRTRLLMEGRRRGASEAFLRAAAAVLVEPKHGHNHDDHFHVRIFCSTDDRPECEDRMPYWPWYEGAPPGGEHTELPMIRWRVPSTVASNDTGADSVRREIRN